MERVLLKNPVNDVIPHSCDPPFPLENLLADNESVLEDNEFYNNEVFCTRTATPSYEADNTSS